MGGGFHMLDIIIFAVVALLLVVKLGSVLGRRGEDEHRPADLYRFPGPDGSHGDEVATPPERPAPTAEELDSMDPLEAGIARIKTADPSFRETEFVKGARKAFEVILEAFAEGDTATLKSLLDNTVYENFAADMEAREKAGHRLETTIVGIEESEIVKAAMDGDLALVSVRFVTDQVNAHKDAAGETVAGDPSRVVRHTDVWTFCRNTRKRDPNWLLVRTGGEDD